jgi:hypothetical protein
MIVERRRQQRLPGSVLTAADETGRRRTWKESPSAPGDPRGEFGDYVEYPRGSSVGQMLRGSGLASEQYMGDVGPLPMRMVRRDGAVTPAGMLEPGEFSVMVPGRATGATESGGGAVAAAPLAMTAPSAMTAGEDPLVVDGMRAAQNLYGAQPMPGHGVEYGDGTAAPGAMVDRNGDGIPDGAQVQLTAKWTKGGAAPQGAGEQVRPGAGAGAMGVLQVRPPALAEADRGMTDRLLAGTLSATDAQQVRTGLAPLNRDTGRRRGAMEALRPAQTAQQRLDQLSEAGAERGTRERLGMTAAAGQVGAAQAMAEVDRQRATLEGRKQGEDAAFKRRDDERADLFARLQREQMEFERGRRQKEAQWTDDVRERSAEDVARGKAAGTPVEFGKTPEGKTIYRAWGDVDPKTGEPTGWKSLASDGDVAWLKEEAARQEAARKAEKAKKAGKEEGKKEEGKKAEERVWNGKRWRLRPGTDRKNQANWDEVGPA